MRAATVALVLVGVLTGRAVTEGTTTTAPVATQAPLAETNVYDARVEALIEDATAALRTLSWQGVEWSWKSVEWSSLDRFDAGVLYHAGAIVGGAGQRVGDMPGVTIMSRQQQAERHCPPPSPAVVWQASQAPSEKGAWTWGKSMPAMREAWGS